MYLSTVGLISEAHSVTLLTTNQILWHNKYLRKCQNSQILLLTQFEQICGPPHAGSSVKVITSEILSIQTSTVFFFYQTTRKSNLIVG